MNEEAQSKEHYDSGKALYDQDLYLEASVEFEKAIQLNPNNADAYLYWGSTLQKREKFEEAIQLLQKALALKPDYAKAYYCWGITLAEQRKFGEAIEQFKTAVKFDPMFADAYLEWGAALQNQQMLEAAIERYQKANEVNPDYPQAYYYLGTAFADQRNFDGAIEQYQQALKLDKTNINIYIALWDALEQQGKYAEAIKVCEQAIAEVYLKLNPKESTQIEKAEAEYRKILKIAPDHIDSLIGLGEVYTAMAELGEKDWYADAIEQYSKAIKLAEMHQGSKRLRTGALVDVYYSRGYRFKLMKPNELLLEVASPD